MKLEPQYEYDEAYALCAGCPTLTLELDKQHINLPYHSYKRGLFHADIINLKFEEGTFVIHGRYLVELWKHLQLQAVRSIRCNKKAEPGEVRVDLIMRIVE